MQRIPDKYAAKMTGNQARDDERSRKKDAWFIQRSLDWPVWPVLPMKRRYRDFMEPMACGFIWDTGTTPPYTVYLSTIYTIKPRVRMNEAVAGMKTETYETLDDLLNEWTVD